MKKLSTLLLLVITSYSFSQSFEVYVSDAGNFNNPPWQILKFDSNGENPSVFINSNLNWPQDILFLEDFNHVLISNLGSGCITKHNASTGTFIENFACSISGPTRIKIGPDSTLYVLQWSGNGKVKRYDLNGAYLGEFTSVGVPQSIGLDWDNSNNLYVSSYNGDMVRKFDSSGNDLGIFIDSNLVGPTNIWFDSSGDLLVVDYNGTAVKRFDNTGNYISDFMTGLSQCEGVAFLPNTDILIGNGATNSVKRFDSSGNYIDDFIASGAGNLLTPNAVVIRQTTASSVTETDDSRASIIVPTIGKEFRIVENQIETIESLVIYDSLGKVIEKIESGYGAVLNLTHLEEGNYFMTFRFDDGNIRTEKIIIRK